MTIICQWSPCPYPDPQAFLFLFLILFSSPVPVGRGRDAAALWEFSGSPRRTHRSTSMISWKCQPGGLPVVIKINTPACLWMHVGTQLWTWQAEFLFMLLHKAQFSPTRFTLCYSQKAKRWGMGRPPRGGGCVSYLLLKILMTAGHEAQTSLLRELREWGDLGTWPRVRHQGWTSPVSVLVIRTVSYRTVWVQPPRSHGAAMSCPQAAWCGQNGEGRHVVRLA